MTVCMRPPFVSPRPLRYERLIRAAAAGRQREEAHMREAVIVSTARTPIGKAYRGAFNNTHGADLGARVPS